MIFMAISKLENYQNIGKKESYFFILNELPNSYHLPAPALFFRGSFLPSGHYWSHSVYSGRKATWQYGANRAEGAETQV